MAIADNHLQLLRAIDDDDVETANEILHGGFHESFLEPSGTLSVTAVQLAAWHGRIELLETLVTNGADINRADDIGRTALSLAASSGNNETVNWLLEHGARTECEIEIHINSWKIARSQELVFIGRNLPVPKCPRRTPLHEAVRKNHPEMVKTLLAAGADVDVRDYAEITPLNLAGAFVNGNDPGEMSKYVDIIDILVSAGANTNTTCERTGITALLRAADLGSHLATRKLLDAGAWPLCRYKESGSTPLHIAATVGSVDTLLVLLSKIPADQIDIPNESNHTALYRAANRGHRDCVRTLIDHGGNLAAVAKGGVTVINAIFTYVPRPIQLLNEILDSRVKTEGRSVDENPNITVDYKVLTPKGQLQTKVLAALIAAAWNIEELMILEHPLVELFLRLKWSQRKFCYPIFIFLNALLAIPLYSHSISLVTMNHVVDKSFISTLTIFLMSIDLIQMLLMIRYLFNGRWSIGLAVCKVILTALLLCYQVIELSELHSLDWILPFSSILILLGWMQFTLFLSLFLKYGYYVVASFKVLKNVLKVFGIFFHLIFGFACCFVLLFHENYQFGNFWKAIVKTMVMMMGEFEYSELFPNEKKENELGYFVVGRIVFLVFILLGSLVLTNLIIALTITDVQDLQKEGHIHHLRKQIELLNYFERMRSFLTKDDRDMLRTTQLDLTVIKPKRDVPSKVKLIYHGDILYTSSSVSIPAELKKALSAVASRNSHDRNSGLMGNEIVDQLVKEATILPPHPYWKIPQEDITTAFKEETWVKSFDKWTSTALNMQGGSTGRKYFQIHNSTKTQLWFHKSILSRHLITWVCRARSDHYSLNASLFKIKITQDPKCQCAAECQDINHILWQCHRQTTV